MPALLAGPGIGPISAAQLLVTWSHPGRFRTEAAFAALTATAAIPASSGRTTRHRINPHGDRHANRALHTIAISRLRYHQPTIAYAARRTAEGKTTREIRRCIKRYLARNLYRLMEHSATAIEASRRPGPVFESGLLTCCDWWATLGLKQ
jgi:transposase